MTIPHKTKIIAHLRAEFENLMAIYAFGSRIQGTENPTSDLDLAILVEGKADPRALWKASGDLGILLDHYDDLLDFRAASTVMQAQILDTGERWWARDEQATIYEVAVLSEKLSFNELRAGILEDIQERGRIYGE